jgi:opacity protein-like surface antigen
MKQLIKLGLLSQVLFSTHLFALNPVAGFYGGIFGEMSHGPSSSQVIFAEDFQVFQGTVGYSPLSAGGGIMLGYKYRQLRGEAEFFINRISTGPVTVGTCVIENVDVVTPTGYCPPGIYDSFEAKTLGYEGNSTASYLFLNGIWDFFSYDGTTDVVPYLGLGLGYSLIRNGSSFVNTTTDASHGQDPSSKGVAYQGILGVSYYMDDFTWCSLDYRYVSSTVQAESLTNLGLVYSLPSKKYTLNTLNITVNFAFDKGAI